MLINCAVLHFNLHNSSPLYSISLDNASPLATHINRSDILYSSSSALRCCRMKLYHRTPYHIVSLLSSFSSLPYKELQVVTSMRGLVVTYGTSSTAKYWSLRDVRVWFSDITPVTWRRTSSQTSWGKGVDVKWSDKSFSYCYWHPFSSHNYISFNSTWHHHRMRIPNHIFDFDFYFYFSLIVLHLWEKQWNLSGNSKTPLCWWWEGKRQLSFSNLPCCHLPLSSSISTSAFSPYLSSPPLIYMYSSFYSHASTSLSLTNSILLSPSHTFSKNNISYSDFIPPPLTVQGNFSAFSIRHDRVRSQQRGECFHVSCITSLRVTYCSAHYWWPYRLW